MHMFGVEKTVERPASRNSACWYKDILIQFKINVLGEELSFKIRLIWERGLTKNHLTRTG